MNRSMVFPEFVLPLHVLSEAQPVTVAVFDVKVATAVGLIAELSRDLYTLALKLIMEHVSVLDPDICVPGVAVSGSLAVGTHEALLFKLAEHDDNAAALHHAESRRFAPEAIVF